MQQLSRITLYLFSHSIITAWCLQGPTELFHAQWVLIIAFCWLVVPSTPQPLEPLWRHLVLLGPWDFLHPHLKMSKTLAQLSLNDGSYYNIDSLLASCSCGEGKEEDEEMRWAEKKLFIFLSIHHINTSYFSAALGKKKVPSSKFFRQFSSEFDILSFKLWSLLCTMHFKSLHSNRCVSKLCPDCALSYWRQELCGFFAPSGKKLA